MLVGMGGMAMGQRLVVAMPDDGGVWVRWTQPDLRNPNGVHVYRREGAAGDWKRLTEQPLTYGMASAVAAVDAVPSLKQARELADGLKAKNKLEGIGLALVLTNSVESRDFGQYLGIMYQDKTAERGKVYAYEVREQSGGTEKSYGTSTEVTAGRLVRQGPPVEIKTLEGDAKLSFGWKPEENRLVGAYIYYKIGGGSFQRLNEKIILPSRVPQSNGYKTYPDYHYLADSLLNGTTYTCVIKGVDLFGFETEPSQEFKLTPRDKTPPAAVQKLAITCVIDHVSLDWQPSGKGVEGIHVYRQRGADTTWVRLTKQPLPASARHYEDMVDEGGMGYVYSVATLDKAGNENRTEPRFIEVKDLKPPVQVRNLKAVADTGVIRLTWFPNPDKDLKGYRVYRIARTAKGGDTIQLNARVLLTNAYNDTLPKVAKNAFSYMVTALDTNYNEGVKSAPATALLPDPEPPQTPTIKAIRKEGEGIKVVWLPGMDVDLAGYLVYRSSKEKGPDSIWKPLLDRPLGARDTAYADRSVEAGTPYYYSVQALDDAGNRSGRSAPFMASVTTVRLRAVPQDVAIKHARGKSEATLTWTLPKTEDVIGCMVYRKQGKDAFLPVSGLLQENKATDSGLKKGETYYYEIRAFDKVGNYSKSAPVTLTIEAE